jgi:catechol 2,3-dioxygenase-like lactoylglutathione lyase family enzyme
MGSTQAVGAYVVRLHHVQVSCPPGGEDAARRLYVEGLGLSEVDKPPVLARRGGCWFRDGDVEVHVGVEEPFTAARKAHPAFVVDDLDGIAARLEELGLPVDRREEHTFPGFRRLHTADGNGNRVELLSPVIGPSADRPDR